MGYFKTAFALISGFMIGGIIFGDIRGSVDMAFGALSLAGVLTWLAPVQS